VFTDDQLINKNIYIYTDIHQQRHRELSIVKMRHCAMKDCTNNSSMKSISFYCFPKCEQEHEQEHELELELEIEQFHGRLHLQLVPKV
jgi:hypothetical protein